MLCSIVSPRRRVAAVLLIAIAQVAALGGTLLGGAARACQAAEKFGNSLDWVPDNVAFYGASLRLAEQHQIIAKSKALEKLMQVPVIQTAWQIFMLQWKNPAGGPFEQIRAILDQPENQELVELAKQMFQQENLYFGDAAWADLAELLVQSSDIMNYGPLFAQITHKNEDPKAGVRLLLNNLSGNLDSLQVPNLVLAFRLSDRKPAENQLRRLEQAAKAALGQSPLPAESLKHVTLQGTDYLTLSLTLGELLRLADLDAQTISEGLKQLEELPGQYQKLAEHLQQMRLHVHVGVWNDYLVVSLGGAESLLGRLGTGASISSRPEMAPLEKLRNERIIAVGYASQALLDKATSSRRSLSTVRALTERGLAETELDQATKQRVLGDLQELQTDLAAVFPAMGAISTFTFLTPRGIEGYTYDWRTESEWDASRPLSLLQHVGGQPMFAFVGRGKSRPNDYDVLVKWVKKGAGYFSDFALPRMGERERNEFNRVWPLLEPLIARLDRANRQYFVPGFADGQSAIVLDTRLTSRQWQQQMPASATPLPMLEPAFVGGVANAELVLQGLTEYFHVARELVELVKKQPHAQVPPDFQIPEPQSRPAGGGTLYWYPLPAEARLDPQIVPNLGLGPEALVLSISQQHSERLLNRQPLEKTGALDDLNRPLASAVYLNWPRLLDAIEPWIGYGVRNVGQAAVAAPGGIDFFLADPARGAALTKADDKKDSPQVQMILGQVHQVIEVLKVLRTATSVTYREGNAFVTHSEAHYQDLP